VQKYEVCEDSFEEFFDNYEGEVYRFLQFPYIVGAEKYVLITLVKNSSGNIPYAHLYWNNKKIYGVRYGIDRFNTQVMGELLVRFYMDNLQGKFCEILGEGYGKRI
jgi:hypothetical protein